MIALGAWPAPLASAGASSSLTDINFGLFFWTLILFGLFALVLSKFGWKPLLSLIEAREQSIRHAVEGAQAAQAEAQALQSQRAEALREAAREREAMLKRAMAEAEQAARGILDRAKTESESLVKRAKEQIVREKEQALREVRVYVADLAIQAATRIVESSLTPEVQRRLVDEFIAALPEQ
jgi:F-type H+-transporting ATPase subunit b